MSELDSSLGTAGGFVCLVDGDGDYNLSEERLQKLIEHVDPNQTQDYSIVGIMGCQSTGKSTLLNRLFNTQFAMMNAETGRSQTTKGIWLDAARNCNNLVIMDLEGTDSGERGEDRTTFERQTILYALALCEILIINMWETDIGRYTASNYGIMKTVFEVNLHLFKAQGKTMLLFIIRDYNEDGTPFHTLQTRLLREIQSIWDELRKPDEFKNSSMYDLFDFKFTYLPHFVYKRERFEDLANQLKQKFVDPNHPDSYLITPYHGTKSVPAESFAKYSSNIWHTIKDNKDLNLPTQREMLAAYRCDELIKTLLAEFHQSLVPIDESIKALSAKCRDRLTNPADDASIDALIAELEDTRTKLASDIQSKTGAIIQSFNQSTEKYIPKVVDDKRNELLDKLTPEVQHLLDTYFIECYIPQIEGRFRKAIKAKVPDAFEKSSETLLTTISEVKEQFEKEFQLISEQFTDALSNIEVIKFSELYTEDLQNTLDGHIADLRYIQFSTVADRVRMESAVAARNVVLTLLANPGMTFWEQLAQSLDDVYAKYIDECAFVYKNYSESEQQIDQHTLLIAIMIMRTVEEVIMSQGDAYVPMMRRVFEHNFYVNGVPRQWKKHDDPHAIFQTARQAGLDLFRQFTTFQLPEHLQGSIAERFEQAKKVDQKWVQPRFLKTYPLAPSPLSVTTEYEAVIQPYLSTALVEVERARSQTGIPPWVFPLVIILGYNEFMYILSNPLLLLLIVMIGVGAFVIHQLGLSGPVLTICKAIFDRVLEQVSEVIVVKAEPGSGSNATKQQNLSIQTNTTTTDGEALSPTAARTPAHSPAAGPSSTKNAGAKITEFRFDQLPDDSDDEIAPTAAHDTSVEFPHSLTMPDMQRQTSLTQEFGRTSSTLNLGAGARQRLKRYGTMTLRRDQIQTLQQAQQEQEPN